MCGIVGFISLDKTPNKSDRARFIREAIWSDSHRGYDSTGIFTVDDDGDCEIIKSTLNGADFVQQPSFGRVVQNIENFRCIVGHNRYKTSGGVSKRDAHPHSHKNIVLVHNGGIDNSYHLPGAIGRHVDDPDVDSYRLTKAMGESSPKEVLEVATGNYALVWYDINQKAVFMARNDGRPLSFIWGKDSRSFYFASEWDMLSWLIRRNGIETADKTFKTYNIQSHVIYKFYNKDGKIQVEKTPYQKPKEREFKTERMYPGLQRYKGPTLEDVMDWPHAITGTDRPLTLPKPGAASPGPFAKSPTTSEIPITIIDPSRPTEKRIKEIERRLKDRNLTYGASIWGVPDYWLAYKKSKNARGYGQLRWIKDETPILLHNLTPEEWQKIVQAGLIIPVTIRDLTNSGTQLVAQVNWNMVPNIREFIIRGITFDDNRIKFIPYMDAVTFKTKKFLTKKEYLDLTKNGCSYCKSVLTMGSASDLVFLDDMPICGDCAEQLHPDGEVLEQRDLANG